MEKQSPIAVTAFTAAQLAIKWTSNSKLIHVLRIVAYVLHLPQTHRSVRHVRILFALIVLTRNIAIIVSN